MGLGAFACDEVGEQMRCGGVRAVDDRLRRNNASWGFDIPNYIRCVRRRSSYRDRWALCEELHASVDALRQGPLR